MLLTDEQYVIKWLSQYGPLPKAQVVRLLRDKSPTTAERLLNRMKRDQRIADVGDGYYLGLDPYCTPDQRVILAVWVLLQFIDRVEPLAHYPATYPSQLFFLKENTGYEIVVLYEGEQHLPRLLQHREEDLKYIFVLPKIQMVHQLVLPRAVGALFYPGGCYAVYNTRDAAMKWKGMGEFKALHSLTEIARLNGGVSRLDGALLFGKSYETALETLNSSDPRHPELRFDSIYPHVHFLPLDDFGARLLGILTLPDWQEKLLDLLFEPSTRTYGRGTMEYDAQVDGVKVLSHLDGDLARLLRFREGLWTHSGKFEVVCFPQQTGFVHSFLGDWVGVREIRIETVEETLQESM